MFSLKMSCYNQRFFLCATFFFLLSIWVPQTKGEKILFIFPLASKSMANIFEPLVKGLAERGHELKVVTPVRIDTPNNTKVIQLNPLSADFFSKDYPEPFGIRRQSKLFAFPMPFIIKGCHQVYENTEFRNLVNEKFDLVVLNIIYNDCFAGLVHKIGSPVILVSSLPPPSQFTQMLGNHMPSSFVPIVVMSDGSDKMNFIQRTKNFLYNMYMIIVVDIWTRPPMEQIYREYLGQELPSVKEILRKQVSLILMNSHFAVTAPRPLLPSVIEIGGIHCQPAKPLPKDLEEFASGAKDGFIVFSMGSIIKASNMPESVRLAFVRTFAKLKQRVIWKWDKAEGMLDLPANVKLVKWLPQQDILGHPNIRLFITHGGLLSTEEAVYHGVPVLGMPVFVDQDANMHQAEMLGFGIKGEILDLTQDKLEPLIRRILEDPRYMSKAKELSRIFRDQPETSLERAIYYSEYVMRHKGAYHLRSGAMELNVFQYHSIDVVLLLLTVSLTTLFVLMYVVKSILKFLFSSTQSSKRKGGGKRKKH
ncbi:unnamed protein product [Orchesella dallaii]|uniref:UDP-glucuronosyltransferase n=1 Tax=Orchesella dallaii TaxID=48710 RepID=A0ABP1Q449_9HEXA